MAGLTSSDVIEIQAAFPSQAVDISKIMAAVDADLQDSAQYMAAYSKTALSDEEKLEIAEALERVADVLLVDGWVKGAYHMDTRGKILDRGGAPAAHPEELAIKTLLKYGMPNTYVASVDEAKEYYNG